MSQTLKPASPEAPRWRTLSSRLAPILRIAASYVPLVLTLVAFAQCVSFSLEYGANVPCSDNWPFVELHERFANGTLRFKHLFAMHNEHLLFVPRVMFALLGWATNHNMHAQALLSLPQLFIVLMVILLASARAFGFSWYKPPWWFAPVPFLLFTSTQSRNLLCSFQSGFITAIPLSVLAYYLLFRFMDVTESDSRARRARIAYFSGAAVLATLGGFSMAMGVCAFPAGLLILLLRRPIQRRYLVAWLAVGAAVWATYVRFYIVSASTDHDNIVAATASKLDELLGRLVTFTVEMLGAPLGGSASDALAAGAIVLVAHVACVIALWRASSLGRASFFFAMSLHALMTCGLVAIGRVHLGGDNALNSRYVTLVVPFWVGTLALAALARQAAREQGRPSRQELGALLTGVSLCICSFAAGSAWLNSDKNGARQRKQIWSQAHSVIRGKNPDKIYADRWRALGLDLPKR